MTKIRILKVVKRLCPEPVRPSKPWPLLGAATRPSETRKIQRAQSILSGPIMAIGRGVDGEGNVEPTGQCPVLTIEQAKDVLRWASDPCRFESE